MPKLILASASPRRRDLLEQIGLEFEVIASRVEEEVDPRLTPTEVARALARLKAAEVSAQYPDDLVIGADTIVVLDEQILGKPRDLAEARRMLCLLSGGTHQVITGLALKGRGREVVDSAVTSVRFRDLSPSEIDAYVQSGESMDKAGAYGIQGKASIFVDSIEGCYFNVVGLPLSLLVRLLKNWGITVL